jgi:hypothetical protein
MHYEIESHTGVGALRFGMSPTQVHEILGVPRFARSDPGHLREMYGRNPALTFTGTDNDLKLIEIGFVKPGDGVTFRGANLFDGECDAIINWLCCDDPDPKYVAGTLVFPKLGISLTGFHAGHRAGLGLTAFAPGTWDAHLRESECIELPTVHISSARRELGWDRSAHVRGRAH